jgi:hypothetical protein
MIFLLRCEIDFSSLVTNLCSLHFLCLEAFAGVSVRTKLLACREVESDD